MKTNLIRRIALALLSFLMVTLSACNSVQDGRDQIQGNKRTTFVAPARTTEKSDRPVKKFFSKLNPKNWGKKGDEVLDRRKNAGDASDPAYLDANKGAEKFNTYIVPPSQAATSDEVRRPSVVSHDFGGSRLSAFDAVVQGLPTQPEVSQQEEPQGGSVMLLPEIDELGGDIQNPTTAQTETELQIPSRQGTLGEIGVAEALPIPPVVPDSVQQPVAPVAKAVEAPPVVAATEVRKATLVEDKKTLTSEVLKDLPPVVDLPPIPDTPTVVAQAPPSATLAPPANIPVPAPVPTPALTSTSPPAPADGVIANTELVEPPLPEPVVVPPVVNIEAYSLFDPPNPRSPIIPATKSLAQADPPRLTKPPKYATDADFPHKIEIPPRIFTWAGHEVSIGLKREALILLTTDIWARATLIGLLACLGGFALYMTKKGVPMPFLPRKVNQFLFSEEATVTEPVQATAPVAQVKEAAPIPWRKINRLIDKGELKDPLQEFVRARKRLTEPTLPDEPPTKTASTSPPAPIELTASLAA